MDKLISNEKEKGKRNNQIYPLWNRTRPSVLAESNLAYIKTNCCKSALWSTSGYWQINQTIYQGFCKTLSGSVNYALHKSSSVMLLHSSPSLTFTA